MGVRNDGTLTGYLHVCAEHIDGVTLYTQDDGVEVEVGSWTAPGPVQGATQWQLDSSEK